MGAGFTPNLVMVHTVLARFKFKEGTWDKAMEAFSSPEIGLPHTVSQPGMLSLETYRAQDDPNLLMVWQKWEKRENQEAYLKWRAEVEKKLFEACTPLFAEPPTFTHLGQFDW